MSGFPRAAAYVFVMAVVFTGVAVLMAKMARTDDADRWLFIIGAVVAAVLVAGALGALRLRSIRRERRRGDGVEAGSS